MKAKVVANEEESEIGEPCIEWSPKEVKSAYSGHMAFYAQNFWRDPLKAKANLDQRHNASGRRTSGPKLRVCYNCDDKFHFVAECPYERREDHNGRLVLKDKSKITKKKPFVKKKKFNKKQTKVVLLNKQEEYSTGEEDSEDDDDSSSEVAAIATTSTSTSSLFDSPNENLINKNAHCFLARASEDYASGGSKWVLDSGCRRQEPPW